MLNIRAEEKVLTYKVSTKSGSTTPFVFSFKNELPFCIKSIKWNYSIPPGTVDSSGYGWPKVPLEITVDTICEEETASPVTFTTPVVARGVSGTVKNRAHLPVELCIQFVGLLVSGDLAGLPDQQIAAFASLDSSQRGMLALPHLLGNNPMHSLPESKPMAALPAKENTAEDKLSLMIGDIFQAAKTLKLPMENLSQLAEALVQKGWAR
jgi:hypothetical protein